MAEELCTAWFKLPKESRTINGKTCIRPKHVNPLIGNGVSGWSTAYHAQGCITIVTGTRDGLLTLKGRQGVAHIPWQAARALLLSADFGGPVPNRIDMGVRPTEDTVFTHLNPEDL